ncbi:MAG: hypothetical protein WA633_12920 [Stellaceae bacterium]
MFITIPQYEAIYVPGKKVLDIRVVRFLLGVSNKLCIVRRTAFGRSWKFDLSGEYNATLVVEETKIFPLPAQSARAKPLDSSVGKMRTGLRCKNFFCSFGDFGTEVDLMDPGRMSVGHRYSPREIAPKAT